ncbi:copper resistance protein CopC [Natronococcus amylolyticus DSM 10524]|uniref:Copper resistance protein CopC n=1 Tax=Natronococcus amylolyticus DSM 10524 TaxID=1227497 RepID=L9WVN4_9EURY|nr:FixH family protein [Natronococcus amylolyticus]ELY53495.1 copper resistance protein CopC [Natronococcus amylolyticus DSM 10524]
MRSKSASRGRGSLLAALLACLVVAGLALGLVATPVAAHAYLSETDPANGEQVDGVPDEITLTFSGDGVVNADITVEGPDGEVVSGESEIDPDDTQLVDVPIEDAADEEGMYTVEWEVLADDGHTTSGSFFFAVGDEPLDRDAVLESHEDDETDESISPIEAGAKGLLLVGIIGLVGIPATAAVAAGPVFARAGGSRRAALDGRVGRLLVGAAVLTLASALALGLVRSTSLGPLSVDTVSQFLETPLGQAWLVQLVVAALVTAVVVWHLRGGARRSALAGTFGGALALAGTVAWTSHSATAIDRLQGTVVDFVHIVGAGLWIGGLAVLALAVVPAARTGAPADRTALVTGAIRRFSVLALGGVTLVVATGFVLASWHVPEADGLVDTVYGLTLVAKLALIAIALGLGGVTRFVLLRRLEPSRATDSAGPSRPASADGGAAPEDGQLRTIVRSIRLELALLVAVLLLSGLLTSAPTAAVTEGDELVESTIEREYDDGILEVSAFPAAEEADGDDYFVLEADEPIVFEVAFLDDDGEPMSSDQAVRLLASSEDGTETEVELEETDDGAYATVQPLAADGRWELRVTGAPEGSYVSEWIDVIAVSPDGHEDHDHGDDDSHDHGDDAHDHEDAHDHDGESDDSAFAVFLQFGAVAVAVVGTVAVTVETLRVRNRD